MDWKLRTAQTVSFAKQYCSKCIEDPYLWKDHTSLVRKYAILLAKKERTNVHIAEIAALLHDTGKCGGHEGHAERSYRLAQRFLKDWDLPQQQRRLILKAIRKHGSKYAGENDEIEVKVLRSADALGTFFNDRWQEISRATMPKAEILKLYDKTYAKIELESARKIAVPRIKKLMNLIR